MRKYEEKTALISR